MPITNLAQVQQVVQNLTRLQTQGNTLSQQLSTGLKSQSYAGYPQQAAQLVNLAAAQSQQQGYIDTINTVDTRLNVMSQATSTMTTLVQNFASQLTTNAYNTDGATIQTQAQALLAEIGNYLNTQDGEGYVFSGAAATTAPFVPGGLPVPGDLTTAVNGAPPAGYYAGDATIGTAQIDSGLTLSYGVTADNPAFEQTVRALNFLANAGPLDQNNPADVAAVNQAQQILTSATTGLQQMTATIGMRQSQLNDLLQAHQNSLALAQGSIADIEKADPATVITQLNALQTQLQASYHAISVLQQLSLADYLP
jgi:flagellar hook-associated protein 3 FlgL